MKIVFVKRPAVERGMSLTDAIRLTAQNGRAVQLRRSPSFIYSRLRREQLLVHTQRRGKFILAWCENGTRATKKGAR